MAGPTDISVAENQEMALAAYMAQSGAVLDSFAGGAQIEVDGQEIANARDFTRAIIGELAIPPVGAQEATLNNALVAAAEAIGPINSMQWSEASIDEIGGGGGKSSDTEIGRG